MERASESASRASVFGLDEQDASLRTLFRPTVLVVEDDEWTARTFVLILKLQGFAAEFARSGAEALARALSAPPDAVLLDLHLADDDVPGFLVLKSLRARHPDLPLIAMTGWYLCDAHEAEARTLGVSDYLFKPVDDSTLVGSLRAVLAARAERATEEPAAGGAGGEGIWSSEAEHSGEGQDDEAFTAEVITSENALVGGRMPRLQRSVRQAFPAAPDHMIAEGSEDALLDFLRELYRGVWPARGSLDRFLYQAAWRNVRDRLQSAARRRAREAKYATEHPMVSWPNESPPDAAAGELKSRLEALASSDAERRALCSWAEGASPLTIAADPRAFRSPAAGPIARSEAVQRPNQETGPDGPVGPCGLSTGLSVRTSS